MEFRSGSGRRVEELGTVEYLNQSPSKQPTMIVSAMKLKSLFVLLILSGRCFAIEPATLDRPLLKVLQDKCSACHADGESEGDFSLDSIQGPIQGQDPAKRNEQLARVFHVLVTAQMPPLDEPPLTDVQSSQMLGVLQGQLAESGLIQQWQRKQLFPEYGNSVDHQALFGRQATQVAWSPSRLWKKSPHLFDSLANRGMGFRPGRYGERSSQLSKLKQPFTMEEKAGIRDFAAIALADSATLETMLRNAEALVDKHLADAMHQRRVKLEGPIPEDQLPKDKNGKPIQPRFNQTPEAFAAIVLADAATTGQVNEAIATMFRLVIEREPDAQELEKYRQLMGRCAKQANHAEALRMMLVAIAVSPPAVYRMELGQGPLDEHGRQMMLPADLAFAIAYALTDQKPDEQLLHAAASGQLTTREDVIAQVTRIWDDVDIEKPRILRFFHEFFGYNAAPGVFKDASRFGKDYRKVPESLVQDADTLVLHIVREDKDVLAQLLTTEKYFVAHSGDNAEERHRHDALQKFYDYYKDKPWREFPYQVPKEHMTYVRSIDRMFTHANGNVTKRWMNYLEQCDQAGLSHMPMQNGRDYITAYNLSDQSFSFPVEQPFVLNPEQRVGILMHPAWLIAHSLNLDNDPIRRGKWIRERLLAGTVPELPITVDASIPEDHEKTLRERLTVTQTQECWRCHVKMNPLGMPFELYDDFGRHRKLEKLMAKGKSKPVDSSGRLAGSGEVTLDGPVQDPIQLVKQLAQSTRVRQSFVRHAFRYWMGRNEMLSDAATLQAADRAYVESEGSFRAMVITLLSSDSFLYRKRMD